MPVIPGEQICIPTGSPAALAIIKQMEDLLARRYRQTVTRRTFIAQWDKLRQALWHTQDYQALRERISRRNGGRCEKCSRVTIDHVHHVVRVAMNPRLALVDSNCKGYCRGCHDKEHRATGKRHRAA